MKIHVLPLAVLAALHCYHGALSAPLQHPRLLVKRDLEFLRQLDLKEDNHRIIKRRAAEEQALSREKRTKRESEAVLKARVEEALGDLIAETPLDRTKRFKRDVHEHGHVAKKADADTKAQEVKNKLAAVHSKEAKLSKRNRSKKQHNRVKKNKKKKTKKHSKKHALLAKKHSQHSKKHKHINKGHNELEKRSKKKTHKKHQKKDKKKMKKKALKHKHKDNVSKKNAPKCPKC